MSASPYEIPPKGSEAAQGWSKFPVNRPLNKPVFVIHEYVIKPATGCNCPHTGGALRIDGKLVDSNTTIWWRYEEELNMTSDYLVDVEPIAQVIDGLAEDLRHRAAELERHAQALRETGDLDEAVAALKTAVSTTNMRIDLLVSRPIRELQRAHARVIGKTE